MVTVDIYNKFALKYRQTYSWFILTHYTTINNATNLFGVVPLQSEFARDLAAGIFTPIKVHAPRTPERERSTTGLGVFSLARTSTAAQNKAAF